MIIGKTRPHINEMIVLYIIEIFEIIIFFINYLISKKEIYYKNLYLILFRITYIIKPYFIK